MRVLLVNSNRSRVLLPAAPIGLSYVAAATRRAGHEVRFLDLILADDPHDELRRAIHEFRPGVVGISVRNIDNVIRQRSEASLSDLESQIAVIREETAGTGRKATVVIGGAAVSILGDAALEHLDADIAVCGEGEASFPALLAALESEGDLGGIPGVCSRERGVVRSCRPEPLPRFGASGLAEWIDWPAYESRGATWPIQTKRGCAMSCTYCAYPVVEGHTHRLRPAPEVVDEIEDVMRRAAPQTFEIVDSTFNIPADHALRICHEIRRRDLGINLTTMGVNPGHTSAELFHAMRQTGFNSMMLTPESASETMLGRLRKGFTVEDVRRTAALARESGIPSMWFFLLGGPGETRETVEETVAFLEGALSWRRAVSVVFTGIRILPGTELCRDAMATGYLPPDADLSRPVFYQSPGVTEEWILNRLDAAIERCPNIMHAAEEAASPFDGGASVAPEVSRHPPPYWRFLPLYLALPHVRAARRRGPAREAAASR